MSNRVISYLCVVVVAVELLAISCAWTTSAIDPFGPFNNPLSGEGVRWMFRNMMSAMMSEWLVALLLLAMSLGCLKGSGLLKSLSQRFPYHTSGSLHYRERMGLRLAAVITAAFLMVMVVLTTLPEALLLSATGKVFPSPFSAAIVPAVSLWIAVTSMAFGIIKGSFSTIHQVFDSFFNGISRFAPLIVLMLLSLHCFNVIKMLVK